MLARFACSLASQVNSYGCRPLVFGLCSGYALVMLWLCSGYALVMLWLCSGYALVMLWLCSGYGAELKIERSSAVGGRFPPYFNLTLPAFASSNSVLLYIPSAISQQMRPNMA
jgi:hypothetical protein